MQKNGEPTGDNRERLPNMWLNECASDSPMLKTDQEGLQPGEGVYLPDWLDSGSWQLSFQIATCMCRKEKQVSSGRTLLLSLYISLSLSDPFQSSDDHSSSPATKRKPRHPRGGTRANWIFLLAVACGERRQVRPPDRRRASEAVARRVHQRRAGPRGQGEPARSRHQVCRDRAGLSSARAQDRSARRRCLCVVQRQRGRAHARLHAQSRWAGLRREAGPRHGSTLDQRKAIMIPVLCWQYPAGFF